MRASGSPSATPMTTQAPASTKLTLKERLALTRSRNSVHTSPLAPSTPAGLTIPIFGPLSAARVGTTLSRAPLFASSSAAAPISATPERTPLFASSTAGNKAPITKDGTNLFRSRTPEMKAEPAQVPVDQNQATGIVPDSIDNLKSKLQSQPRPSFAIESASQPLDFGSQTLDSASEPLHSTSQPLDPTFQSLDSTSSSLDSASQPLDFASQLQQSFLSLSDTNLQYAPSQAALSHMRSWASPPLHPNLAAGESVIITGLGEGQKTAYAQIIKNKASMIQKLCEEESSDYDTTTTIIDLLEAAGRIATHTVLATLDQLKWSPSDRGYALKHPKFQFLRILFEALRHESVTVAIFVEPYKTLVCLPHRSAFDHMSKSLIGSAGVLSL